jgi:DNA processing protein
LRLPTDPASAPSGTDDLAHWLRLGQTGGVGPETARKLLAAFGLPQHIFSSNLASLCEVVSPRVARALLEPAASPIQDLIDRSIDWAGESNHAIVTLGDAAYPAALLEIADPPLILYVKGRIELLSRPSLAVVGSRNATAQGLAHAEQFPEALSSAGLTIVSGMALGIDTAAHRGALRHARIGGSTVAVIGTGVDITYPSRNRQLAEQIAQEGCIVSEYPLGMPPIAANFPRRNRIISGLSRGVLVVEAAAQSGSLITARMAAEQGRDVFSIPGSIHSPLAKGCHHLIKQGAKLVESAQDILEDIGQPACAATPAPTLLQTTPANALLEAMGFDPVDADTLAMRAGVDTATLAAQLLMLELEGAIERLPGEIYRRLH